MDIPHLFIHSSADKHLGCFCLSTVTNKSARNMCVQVLDICFHMSLGQIPSCRIVRSYGAFQVAQWRIHLPMQETQKTRV